VDAEIRSSRPRYPGGSPPPAGFYRTCAIDGVLEDLPAEHVRRPAVPQVTHPRSTHLQFEALLTVARQSPGPCGFALVAYTVRAGGLHRQPQRATQRVSQHGRTRAAQARISRGRLVSRSSQLTDPARECLHAAQCPAPELCQLHRMGTVDRQTPPVGPRSSSVDTADLLRREGRRPSLPFRNSGP
jgi:hypothetical protein